MEHDMPSVIPFVLGFVMTALAIVSAFLWV